jgi:hypothetical protein
MSGGSLDYFYYTLDDHSNDFDDKELNNLVSDLAQLFHDREWNLSGDTSRGDWREARDKFKDKWFTEHGRQERIEKYLAEIGGEIRAMFGMSKKCQTCKHWKRESECYGKCEYISGCLMHRSESCERHEEVRT